MLRYVDCRHVLINYIDTKAKCCHLKKLTCKGTLLQVFNRVYIDWRAVSHVCIFHPALWTVAPLSLSQVQLSPPPSLCEYKYTVYNIQCGKGGGYGILGLRQINTCSTVPAHSAQVNICRWRHFALTSLSLIFLVFYGMLNASVLVYLSTLELLSAETAITPQKFWKETTIFHFSTSAFRAEFQQKRRRFLNFSVKGQCRYLIYFCSFIKIRSLPETGRFCFCVNYVFNSCMNIHMRS